MAKHRSPGEVEYEYKVITRNAKFLNKRTDKDGLEMALNHYASRGWRVISITSANRLSSLTYKITEIVVVLERVYRDDDEDDLADDE